MNLQLDETYEVIYNNGERKEELIGEIFIRCNNVLFIREDVSKDVEAADEATTGVKKEDEEMSQK